MAQILLEKSMLMQQMDLLLTTEQVKIKTGAGMTWALGKKFFMFFVLVLLFLRQELVFGTSTDIQKEKMKKVVDYNYILISLTS